MNTYSWGIRKQFENVWELVATIDVHVMGAVKGTKQVHTIPTG
jgi:hypothetical protein